MKFAEFIYDRLEKMDRKPNRILYNSAVREALQALDSAGDIQKQQKEYVLQKISICSMIVVFGTILALALWIKDANSIIIADNKIERNKYGEGSQNVGLVANDGNAEYDIDLSIDEKLYTDAELNTLLNEFIPLLENKMLGQNASFDKIEYDLDLVSGLSGYPFDVEWSVPDEYVDYEGHLLNNELNEPQLAELMAKISCGVYEVNHTINCMVYSKAVQPETPELIIARLKEIESGTREENFMTLPSEINSESISWSYKRNYRGLLFLIAVPIVAIAIYYSKDRDLIKQVEERNGQMKMDYPEIVSSLALLIGAGMTVPNAWQKIVRDYRVKKQETGKKRYAYEEMLFAINEMESGVSQTMAYERFGRRCRIQSYNKLATLLSQNIRKGTSNLSALLREEAANAFEERKHTARKLGEKAGTKLLFPMMMILGMIMVVIMVPAFKTYL